LETETEIDGEESEGDPEELEATSGAFELILARGARKAATNFPCKSTYARLPELKVTL